MRKFSLHLRLFRRFKQPHAGPLQQDRLVRGRLADAVLPDLHTLPRGQDEVHQSDLREVFKHLPRLMAEPGLATAGAQRLPQHIGQKTHRGKACCSPGIEARRQAGRCSEHPLCLRGL